MFNIDMHGTYVINFTEFFKHDVWREQIRGRRLVTSILLALIASIGEISTAHSADVDSSLRADLERIAKKRIFFGHQSVGVNLLDGIKQLSEMADVPVQIVEVKTASSTKLAMIGHAFIAKNGNPLLKLKSFEHAMGLQDTGVDIALVKFCYVDFTAETDAKSLFATYRTTIDGLRARNPGTTFVHVTAPLTTAQDGFKSQMKRLLGRAPYGTIENLRREEYNALLRQAFMGKEPMFDLARIESTAPDGSAVTTEWNGSAVPAMSPAYTYDGGHLNATGRLRAARELVSVIASIPNQAVGSNSTR